MALEMSIIDMEVYGDSKLIINQLFNIYEVKKEDLVPFFWQAPHLLKGFESVTLNHIPRNENRMVNALVNLATSLAPSKGEMTNIPVCNRWVIPSVDPFDHEDFNAITIVTTNEKDWRTPPVEYLKHSKLPDDTRHKIEGLDVVGPITPKSSIGHIYILAATDYFLKWAEAVPLKEVKKEIMKVVSKLKRDWHEKIGEALWMYLTMHRTATQSTPYSLVHGVEAVLLESQIPSLCIAI
ncbi:UNVERIFIED_CONTAM: hypothetical protein Sangu_2576900 [Sesamum angustifolium]|uniref:RNase H type-1 domain-containing protein n=1 Tax=Sesamum angustifolium TaxID=2727405 RepID=A0AAW2J6X8_9LAMI